MNHQIKYGQQTIEKTASGFLWDGVEAQTLSQIKAIIDQCEEEAEVSDRFDHKYDDEMYSRY